jgi:hypothetical protein
MALTRSSVLHYFDARLGEVPIVGGNPHLTRTTAGGAVRQNGLIHRPLINTPRFRWDALYGDDPDSPTVLGKRRQTMLLEMARTNDFSYSEDFTNAVWTKTRVSIESNVAIAPDGTLTADKLKEDTSASTTHILQRLTPALTDNTRSSHGFALKPAGRDWVMLRMANKSGSDPFASFNIAAGTKHSDNSSLARIEPLGDGWYLCWVSVDALTGAGTPEVKLYLCTGDAQNSYTGDGTSGVFIWGANFAKDRKFLTSYYPAATGSVSRAADSFYHDFTHAPQQMGMYVRFKEAGTILGDLSERVFQIGAAAGGDPRLMIYASGGLYHAFWSNNSTGRQWDLAAAPAFGDTVELLFRIDSDGTGALIQSVNGAAVTSVVNASAQAFAAAWSDTRLGLNSVGSTSIGAIALAEVKIVERADMDAGTAQAQMDELRAFRLSLAGEVV